MAGPVNPPNRELTPSASPKTDLSESVTADLLVTIKAAKGLQGSLEDYNKRVANGRIRMSDTDSDILVAKVWKAGEGEIRIDIPSVGGTSLQVRETDLGDGKRSLFLRASPPTAEFRSMMINCAPGSESELLLPRGEGLVASTYWQTAQKAVTRLGESVAAIADKLSRYEMTRDK